MFKLCVITKTYNVLSNILRLLDTLIAHEVTMKKTLLDQMNCILNFFSSNYDCYNLRNRMVRKKEVLQIIQFNLSVTPFLIIIFACKLTSTCSKSKISLSSRTYNKLLIKNPKQFNISITTFKCLLISLFICP